MAYANKSGDMPLWTKITIKNNYMPFFWSVTERVFWKKKSNAIKYVFPGFLDNVENIIWNISYASFLIFEIIDAIGSF